MSPKYLTRLNVISARIGNHYFTHIGNANFGYCSCGAKLKWNRPQGTEWAGTKDSVMADHIKRSREELIEKVESFPSHCECPEGPMIEGRENWIVSRCDRCMKYPTQAKMFALRQKLADKRAKAVAEEKAAQREIFNNCPRMEEEHKVYWTEELEGPPYAVRHETVLPSHEKAFAFLKKLGLVEGFSRGMMVCSDGVEYEYHYLLNNINAIEKEANYGASTASGDCPSGAP